MSPGSSKSHSSVSESNPFFLLTIVYSWSEEPDLDTGTTFLGQSVGYNLDSGTTYMTWDGDVTGPYGPETVTVDLALAWENEQITTQADIACAADWFPPSGGSGPANIDVTYNGVTQSAVVSPGTATPSTTFVLPITVYDDGTFDID